MLFTVLGSIVALAIGVVAVAYSPAMALREVRVEGAERVPAAEIESALAGVLGTPLPLIGSDDVHAALADFRLVETYSTEAIPPGTLVIRIVERTPVGVIESGDAFELVDAAGVVIEQTDEQPAGQPIIDAQGGTAGEGFRAAAGVIRSLPDSVRSQLAGVSAATVDDVRLELSGGASVLWGSAEESSLKATVLESLMRAAPPDSVDEYDVSAPTSPVVS